MSLQLYSGKERVKSVAYHETKSSVMGRMERSKWCGAALNSTSIKLQTNLQLPFNEIRNSATYLAHIVDAHRQQ